MFSFSNLLENPYILYYTTVTAHNNQISQIRCKIQELKMKRKAQFPVEFWNDEKRKI